MRNRPTLRARKGFTLVELLVVIVIIGLLAATALPSFNSTKASGLEASVKSDLRNAIVGAEAHYARNGSYTNVANDTANWVKSPGNVLSLPAVAASTITIKFYNAAASRNCSQKIGSGATALACADGP